ncbi:MAG TPA: DUF1566 domain-containing protein, partial [Sphaerochaeta sp.]|nr:DUF1566 domain-containing protein [Sphaerochaeta sp.]
LTEVREIAGGGNMSFMVKKDNTLWACGENKYGQLGLGNAYDQLKPVKIMEGVSKVAVGGNHVLVLRTDNSVWSCGYNEHGQLGNGTTTNSTQFKKILDGGSTIAAGNNHSLVVKTDASLWTFGYNDYYMLGNGNDRNQSSPVKILDRVQDAAAGAWHSMALDTEGYLYTFGRNTQGQLGTDEDNRSYKKTPQKVLADVKIQFIAGSEKYSLIATSKGQIGASGYEGEGYSLFGNDGYQGQEYNYFKKASNSPSNWYEQGVTLKPGEVVITDKSSYRMVDSLKMGERGPAGGFVFYDKGNYDGGWRYLEADAKDLSIGGTETFVWGGAGKELGPSAQGVAIGTGKLNTETIVSRFGNAEPYENSSHYAAKLCEDNVSGGFDDWFLPSRDELGQMYKNLAYVGVGGFSDSYYWSSSESNANYAWGQHFNGGGQDNSYRDGKYRVRPVRAF